MLGSQSAEDAEPAWLADLDPQPQGSDWLPLQQAACELGMSPGTVRRMIRRGELRNRIVPRPGGFAYLVYLPDSWHGRFAALEQPPAAEGSLVEASTVEAPAVDVSAPLRRDRVEATWPALSQSQSHALVSPAAAHPLRLAGAEDAFSRFRSLARRRRWWRF